MPKVTVNFGKLPAPKGIPARQLKPGMWTTNDIGHTFFVADGYNFVLEVTESAILNYSWDDFQEEYRQYGDNFIPAPNRTITLGN